MIGKEQVNKLINYPSTAKHVKKMFMVLEIKLEDGERIRFKIGKN